MTNCLGKRPKRDSWCVRLDPNVPHTARVKTVWDDGVESPRAAEITFNLAALAPRVVVDAIAAQPIYRAVGTVTKLKSCWRPRRCQSPGSIMPHGLAGVYGFGN